jgi:DNA-binding CsgD family transcriptional regulator
MEYLNRMAAAVALLNQSSTVSPAEFRDESALAVRELAKTISDLAIDLRLIASVLNLLPQGCVVLSDELRLVLINTSARSVLEANRGLTLVKQQLACMDGRSQHVFLMGFRQLQSGSRQSVALRVVCPGNAADLQLYISRIYSAPAAPRVNANSVGDSTLESDNVFYCVWIHDATLVHDIDRSLLRELHGLTATEAHVAELLFRGLTLDDTAIELRVSINTVKTHLKHIFQKCEVSTQAELLKMLALGPR